MDAMRQSFAGHDDAWEQFIQAYRFQMAGRLDDALEAYQRSIDLHPTAEALTFYGWALSFQGRVDEAIDYCKRAIETDPDFGNPYNDIGAYLLKLGRPGEAVDWLNKALKAPRYASPQFPYTNLGQAYESLEDTEQAIGSYKRALAIDPSHGFAQSRLLFLIGMKN